MPNNAHTRDTTCCQLPALGTEGSFAVQYDIVCSQGYSKMTGEQYTAVSSGQLPALGTKGSFAVQYDTVCSQGYSQVDGEAIYSRELMPAACVRQLCSANTNCLLTTENAGGLQHNASHAMMQRQQHSETDHVCCAATGRSVNTATVGKPLSKPGDSIDAPPLLQPLCNTIDRPLIGSTV